MHSRVFTISCQLPAVYTIGVLQRPFLKLDPATNQVYLIALE